MGSLYILVSSFSGRFLPYRRLVESIICPDNPHSETQILPVPEHSGQSEQLPVGRGVLKVIHRVHRSGGVGDWGWSVAFLGVTVSKDCIIKPGMVSNGTLTGWGCLCVKCVKSHFLGIAKDQPLSNTQTAWSHHFRSLSQFWDIDS